MIFSGASRTATLSIARFECFHSKKGILAYVLPLSWCVKKGWMTTIGLIGFVGNSQERGGLSADGAADGL